MTSLGARPTADPVDPTAPAVVKAHGVPPPAPERPDVSVVLPCLNEAGSVAMCVAEAFAAMRAAGIEGEVVVVDNGSTDASVEIAGAAGARVVNERHRGYGAALRTGFGAARANIIVMADADLTYDLRRIPDLVAPLREDTADLVVASRLNAATRSTMPVLHRVLGTPVLSFLVDRACGRRVVSDSQSGFRAFRRDRLDMVQLRASGMELASEMLIRAARSGLRIKEVHAGYRQRVGESKLNTFSDGWRHLRLIFFLAPDLLLIGPGAFAFVLGAFLAVLGFVRPAGIDVGSLRWQPVFFSSVCMVLGLQALLAGAVLAYRLSLRVDVRGRRWAFVGRRWFPAGCVLVGCATLLGGLGVDLVLFVDWVRTTSPPSARTLPAAGLAQTMLLAGGSLASFGIVAHVLVGGDDFCR